MFGFILRHKKKFIGGALAVGLAGAIALAGGPAATAAALIGRPQLTVDVRSDLDTLKTYGAATSAETPIDHISGSIFAEGRATVAPGIKLTGFSGVFTVTVSGQVDRTTAAVTPGKAVQPQFTVWADCDGDNKFENGEGIMSPNATIPDAKNRSVTVNGFTAKVKLWKACTTRLLFFGYSVDGSTYGGGDTPADSELTVAKGASIQLVPTR